MKRTDRRAVGWTDERRGEMTTVVEVFVYFKRKKKFDVLYALPNLVWSMAIIKMLLS